jgi:hypothetical protein
MYVCMLLYFHYYYGPAPWWRGDLGRQGDEGRERVVGSIAICAVVFLAFSSMGIMLFYRDDA